MGTDIGGMMRVIRGIGQNKEERVIDFSRSIVYETGILSGCKGVGIPVKKFGYVTSYMFFWNKDNIKMVIDKDEYQLNRDNPNEFMRLKHNLELLFALKVLK